MNSCITWWRIGGDADDVGFCFSKSGVINGVPKKGAVISGTAGAGLFPNYISVGQGLLQAIEGEKVIWDRTISSSDSLNEVSSSIGSVGACAL